jgi:hypothetical protein
VEQSTTINRLRAALKARSSPQLRAEMVELMTQMGTRLNVSS